MLLARADVIADAFGLAWQWTGSAYLPYPDYRAAKGVIVSQMVLRGSSVATPRGQERVSYRNFLYPPLSEHDPEKWEPVF